jgi:hypothetical protein
MSCVTFAHIGYIAAIEPGDTHHVSWNSLQPNGYRRSTWKRLPLFAPSRLTETVGVGGAQCPHREVAVATNADASFARGQKATASTSWTPRRSKSP